MAGSRSWVRASGAASALVLALTAPATACGSSADRAAPTTTSRPPSTTATTSTTTELPGVIPIPTDPAELASCEDVPTDGPAVMPSRRWPTLPTGWQVRYAYTTRPEGEGNSWFGRAALIRVGAQDRVTGLVLVGTGPVRGVPGRMGPQAGRGGPTGALEVAWQEGDVDVTVVSRGLDDAELRALVEDLDLADGAVTTGPDGWRLLGSDRSDGVISATVIGITPAGTHLLETGYAPVEVQVEEPTPGTPSAGAIHVPAALDVEHGGVFLLEADGRPALVTSFEDGGRLVQTTTTDGAPVSASGPVTGAELAAAAASAVAIPIDDERLVGVPMGTSGSSPGRFCR